MTQVEAVKMVALLAAGFSTPAWAEETIRLYATELVDLDQRCTQEVIHELLQTRITDRRPTIGEIRVRVAERQANDAGLILLSPEDAWGFVLQQIARIGHVGEFPAKHPLVTRVVERLGWRNLCLSENSVADRARFLELYRDLHVRTIRDAAGSPGAMLRMPVDRLAEPMRTPVAAPAGRNDLHGSIGAILADTRARLECRRHVRPEEPSAEVKEAAVVNDDNVLVRRSAQRERLRAQSGALLRGGGDDPGTPSKMGRPRGG